MSFFFFRRYRCPKHSCYVWPRADKNWFLENQLCWVMGKTADIHDPTTNVSKYRSNKFYQISGTLSCSICFTTWDTSRYHKLLVFYLEVYLETQSLNMSQGCCMSQKHSSSCFLFVSETSGISFNVYVYCWLTWFNQFNAQVHSKLHK